MGKKKSRNPDKKLVKSSGMSRACRARQQLRQIRIKINRWKRYVKEERMAIAPRRQGWNTSNLEKHASFLESIIKQGSTTR